MVDTPSDTSKWKIDFFDDDTKTEYDSYFQNYPKQKHVKKSFENDVKNNPFYHPVTKRIKFMKGNYKGLLRYGKSDTRIIYKPISETKTVYPVETGKNPDISYKRGSKKKNYLQ